MKLLKMEEKSLNNRSLNTIVNQYDEIGKIVDKLEKLLNDEELNLGNAIDDVTTGPGGVDEPVTLGEVAEMNMTNQEPRYFEDLWLSNRKIIV